MTTETVPTEPTPPPLPIDPAVPPPVDPPAPPEPPVAEPPASPPEPPVAADTGDKLHGNKGRTPWYIDRIKDESAGRMQAEARAAELQQMLERSQKAPSDPLTPAASRTDETAIETRARQIAQETLNGEKIRTVISAGLGKFTDWDERAATLGAAGAATPDFVLDVVSVDPQNAHVILHQLAEDPQKAARLAKMDTRTRTIELVKMSMAASGTTAPLPEPAKPAPPPKTVSKAPPPPPPVEPGASQVIDWRSDKASDEEFSRGWEENLRKRAGRERNLGPRG